MVNDLTTLSGALIECKDQLITELANKGVTATYDPTTGLLGLIAHIADIQGGEAILLTTDKNILSYADSETATLTAVHSMGSGKSLAVYNAVSGAKIGDMTDNQDGTYSYTYSSTGTGDISMTCATLTGESNSITIEDCIDYDDTTADKISSKYTITSLRQSGTRTLTYDSTNHVYKITINTSGESTALINSTTGLNNITIEYDARHYTTESNCVYGGADGLHTYSSSSNWIRVGGTCASQSVGTNNNGSYTETEESLSLANGSWYHHKFTITNNTMKHEIFDSNSSSVWSKTVNVNSSWFTNSTKYGLALLWANTWSNNAWLKNIKVKPLPTQ